MTYLFRNIDYGRMLYEALRNYFSVNPEGDLSILYRYLACFVQPLQQPFDDYDAARRQDWLVAQCKWQVGQMTNVLNFIFDTNLKRITIGQSTITSVGAPKFPYATTAQTRKFGEAPGIQARKFFDALSSTTVIFNIPSTVNVAAITARIEQIRPSGIQYTINVIP